MRAALVRVLIRTWPRVVHLVGGVYRLGPLDLWLSDQTAGFGWRFVFIWEWRPLFLRGAP